MLMNTPNLPFPQEWNKMSSDQKLEALYRSLDQVWQLLSENCEHLQRGINRIATNSEPEKAVRDEQVAWLDARLTQLEQRP